MKAALPKGIESSDTQYPSYEDKDHIPYEKQRELGLDATDFTLYFVKGIGKIGGAWVLTTLHISKAKRGSKHQTDRTYAIGVDDEKVYTVGRGPHVLQEVRIYLKKSNLERLMPFVELWKKGMELAGGIRDRISTRRAQGQLHRANGRTSWMW